jgi:hypothetical protein
MATHETWTLLTKVGKRLIICEKSIIRFPLIPPVCHRYSLVLVTMSEAAICLAFVTTTKSPKSSSDHELRANYLLDDRSACIFQ